MTNSFTNVKVEIVLPNYNSEPYLKETINSIIKQTFKKWKLTIVDANSNAKTQKILNSFKKNKKIFIMNLEKKKKSRFL